MGWGGGWGNHAPETAKTVAGAFYQGRTCKRGNCRTDGRVYWLAGNMIAVRRDDDEVARNMTRAISGCAVSVAKLEFTFADWPTKMTARHLTALGIKAECCGIENPKCFMNGKQVEPSKWYTLEALAALPDLIPEVKKPKPDTRFVNLTLPLFDDELCAA